MGIGQGTSARLGAGRMSLPVPRLQGGNRAVSGTTEVCDWPRSWGRGGSADQPRLQARASRPGRALQVPWRAQTPRPSRRMALTGPALNEEPSDWGWVGGAPKGSRCQDPHLPHS